MDIAEVVVRTVPSDDREFGAFVSEALGALIRSGFSPDRVLSALGPLVRAEYPGACISERAGSEPSTVYVVRARRRRSKAEPGLPGHGG